MSKLQRPGLITQNFINQISTPWSHHPNSNVQVSSLKFPQSGLISPISPSSVYCQNANIRISLSEYHRPCFLAHIFSPIIQWLVFIPQMSTPMFHHANCNVSSPKYRRNKKAKFFRLNFIIPISPFVFHQPNFNVLVSSPNFLRPGTITQISTSRFHRTNFGVEVSSLRFCCIEARTTWLPISRKYKRHCVS